MLQLFKELEKAMRNQCPLFDKTFKKIEWAGSYYKGTRVGQPEEYDLNFVIKLPFKEKDLKVISFFKLIMHITEDYSSLRERERKKERERKILSVIIYKNFLI